MESTVFITAAMVFDDLIARGSSFLNETKEGADMLFIGYFSYDEIDMDGKPRHGYFSSIVDADHPDAAMAKFESHIKKMKNEAEEMADIVNVYIEEILKIGKIPDTPMITRLQSSEGEFPSSISYSLPGGEDDNVEAFGYAPDIDNQDDADDGNFIEAHPFLTFDNDRPRA